MSKSALQLTNIAHTYDQAGHSIDVLKGVSLEIKPGEIVALVGPSGAGKSTLLQIAGLLDKPTSGDITINGHKIRADLDSERTLTRRNDIGFVYQFHHLLPEFTAFENIMLPLMIAGKSQAKEKAWAEELLSMVGLTQRAQHLPSQMSGGEQQRIAIARAIANKPKLLLADEPTGNLDTKTSHDVFEQLQKLIRKQKIGALIATHNQDLAQQMDRIIRIVDGKLDQNA